MKRLSLALVLLTFLAPLALQATVLERPIPITGSELLECGVVAAGNGTGVNAERLALQATKNAESTNVLLGKYEANLATSYEQVALRNNATYFQLDDWDQISSVIGKENMWDINGKFLDQQWSQGKNFFFSHDPWASTNSFQKEILHIIDLGAKDFVPTGTGMWKVIR